VCAALGRSSSNEIIIHTSYAIRLDKGPPPLECLCSETLHKTSAEMFEGDLADTCSEVFPLMGMDGGTRNYVKYA
jgi:hypothetical protein